MNTGDSKNGYGVVSILNHWIVGLCVIGLIIVGTILGDMDQSPEKNELRNLHKAFGTLVFVLAAWRLGWRLKQGFPDPSPDYSPMQNRAARYLHWFLLIGIVLMPLSGLLWSLSGGHGVSFFGLFTIPAFADADAVSGFFGDFHRIFVKLLALGILGHSALGLYHAATDFKAAGGRMFIPR